MEQQRPCTCSGMPSRPARRRWFQSCMVRPTTLWPSARSMAATVEESTPPDIATAMVRATAVVCALMESQERPDSIIDEPERRKGAKGLLCRRIGLKNAERILFRVEKVPLPAHSRNGELGQGDPAAGAQDLYCCRIKVCHFHRTDECVGPVLGWRRLRWPLQQPAARPFRLDSPVLDRQSFNLAESPAKDLAVKTQRATGTVGLDFKIGWSVHRSSIIKERNLPWPLGCSLPCFSRLRVTV